MGDGMGVGRNGRLGGAPKTRPFLPPRWHPISHLKPSDNDYISSL